MKIISQEQIKKSEHIARNMCAMGEREFFAQRNSAITRQDKPAPARQRLF